VRRHVLVFGLAAGALIAILQAVEYRYLVLERSVEIYGAIVAVLFAAAGIWLGRRLTRPRERIVIQEVTVPARLPSEPFRADQRALDELGMTPRELEILQLIAEGLSNKEIAERSFISENTVKTHSSRVFEKLGVNRRVQAVQRGRELRLIP
jgi:two-component system, NarL family, response regulator LiaR